MATAWDNVTIFGDEKADAMVRRIMDCNKEFQEFLLPFELPDAGTRVEDLTTLYFMKRMLSNIWKDPMRLAALYKKQALLSSALNQRLVVLVVRGAVKSKGDQAIAWMGRRLEAKIVEIEKNTGVSRGTI